MNLRTLLLPAACGLIGLPAGAFLYHHGAEIPATLSKSPQAATPSPDPAPAAAGIINGSDSAALIHWSAQVAGTPPGELPALAALLTADPHRLDRALWTPILARWSASDGPGMIAWLEKNSPPGLREPLLEDGWLAWGASDPDRSFAASGKLTPALCKQLLAGIAETDPRKAAAFAMRLPDPDSLVHSISGTLVSRAPDAAEQLMTRAVHDGGRIPLQEARIRELAASDPAAAIDYARRTGVLGSDPVPQAIHAIAATAPLQAAAQIAAMPSTRTRALSTVALAHDWAASDPAAAVDWIHQLDDGPARSSALLAAAASPLLSPQAALGLIAETGWSDPSRFFGIYDSGPASPYETQGTLTPRSSAAPLVLKWAATDPAAARSYVENISQPDLRAYLLDQLKTAP